LKLNKIQIMLKRMKKQNKKYRINYVNFYRHLKKEKNQKKIDNWLWNNYYSKLVEINILYETNK